jgi:3'(2'), 5'-bisphosphate nucleotidase
MTSHQDLLAGALRIAGEAASTILGHYHAGVASTEKDDGSPLTAADQAASDLICARLAELDLGAVIISEESAGAIAATLPDRFWIVDPLDGTKEFLKRTGEFTVNIALIEDGAPVIGVVHVPVSGTTYYGSAAGAFVRRAGEAPQGIGTRPADPPRLAIVASRDHAGPQVARLLAALPEATTLSMGSSLKFCLVAEGRADLYLRDVPTMEWDTAAAHCVVSAAGGQVLTLDAQPLRYGKPGLRNPSLVTIGDAALPWSSYLQ